jgi:hypothetical protein
MNYLSMKVLLFPEKEAKSVSSASQKTVIHPELSRLAPWNSSSFWHPSFSKKEAQIVSSALQKTVIHPELG